MSHKCHHRYPYKKRYRETQHTHRGGDGKMEVAVMQPQAKEWQKSTEAEQITLPQCFWREASLYLILEFMPALFFFASPCDL